MVMAMESNDWIEYEGENAQNTSGNKIAGWRWGWRQKMKWLEVSGWWRKENDGMETAIEIAPTKSTDSKLKLWIQSEKWIQSG